MPKIAYQAINMSQKRLDLVTQCNTIIGDYSDDGLLLTLRQLFYQLVSRDIIPNTVQEYKRLGDVVNDARLAGLMDWSAIEDRTRELVTNSHWNGPADILDSCVNSFQVDRWADQDVHPEVWIEKEALSGVFERICSTLDVGCFACRGYTSQSEMWGAAQRFVRHVRAGREVVIFHFGDHDPSGIDMTRDIMDRIKMFASHHLGSARAEDMIKVRRLALNMDQVRKYNPPENPAKTTDARFAGYEALFGDKSWELDALNPRALQALVRDNVMSVCDKSLWDSIIDREAKAKGQLKTLQVHYDEIIDLIRKDEGFAETMDENTSEAKSDLQDEMGVTGDEDGEDDDE